MTHLAAELRARGATRWCLNVKPDNVAALALNAPMGLQPAYRSTALRLPWSLVERLPPSPRFAARLAAELF